MYVNGRYCRCTPAWIWRMPRDAMGHLRPKSVTQGRGPSMASRGIFHIRKAEAGGPVHLQHSYVLEPIWALGPIQRLQGWPKRWTPGSVNMRWKSCVLLPAAGSRTQFFLLTFTETGVHLLGHPCKSQQGVIWARQKILKFFSSHFSTEHEV